MPSRRPAALRCSARCSPSSAATRSLLAAFRARIFDPRRAIIHDVVARGIVCGDVATDADREAIDSLLFGALLARAILGEAVDAAWIDRVVDQLWRGVAAPPGKDTPA